MSANTKACRSSNVMLHSEGPAIIPSPAKVQARAAKIRQSWTPQQRRRRAQVARYVLLEQLIGETPTAQPGGDDAF
jgi:hypothetical protein